MSGLLSRKILNAAVFSRNIKQLKKQKMLVRLIRIARESKAFNVTILDRINYVKG